MSNNAEMKEYWSGYFAPFPPTDLSELRWLARQAARWFDESGVLLGAVALVLLLLGAISIFKRDRVHFSILALPILLLLIASGLNIFPMTTRVILFILPLLYIFAAAGAEDARLASAPASILPSVVLATALCLGPLCYASLRIVEPRLHEESRSAIELVKENWREGDTLYVFRGGRIAFHYYGRLRYHMEGDRVILGSGPKRNVAGFESDLEKLRSRGRVWFFFSNVRKMGTGEIDEEQFFLQRLESMGERLDGFLMRGASTYLYDLNESG